MIWSVMSVFLIWSV